MLDFRRLRYFTAIAELGSLSAAARSLRVAQPALSHHLAELETELATKLMIRRPRGVELTESGRLLLERAEFILKLVVDAEAEVRRSATQQSMPVLSVAVIPSLLPLLTANLLSAGDQMLPGVSARITEARTEYSHMLIQSGKLDIAVNQGDPSWPRTNIIMKEPFFLASPPGRGNAYQIVTLDEVLSQPLILPTPSNPLRRMFDETLNSLGRRAQTLMEVDGLDTVKRLVAGGTGSAILNWAAVYEESRNGTLHVQMIVEPTIYRNLTIEHSISTSQADVNAFTKALRNALRNTLSGTDSQFDHFLHDQL